MIIGSPYWAPHDNRVLRILIVFAVVLLMGALTAPEWATIAGVIVRRGTVALAIGTTGYLYLRSPSQYAMVGLSRMLTIWPALGASLIFYGVWSWRAGQW